MVLGCCVGMRYFSALREKTWFPKVEFILGVLAFYRIGFNGFMPQIVLSGREMKMAECIDFSRDLRLWWKLEILRKFSSIVQKNSIIFLLYWKICNYKYDAPKWLYHKRALQNSNTLNSHSRKFVHQMKTLIYRRNTLIYTHISSKMGKNYTYFHTT